MKKIVSFVLSATMISPIVYSNAQTSDYPGDFYIGGTIGRQWSDLTLSDGNINGKPIADFSFSNNGWDTSFIIGWGWHALSGFYAGIEGEMDLGLIDSYRSNQTGDVTKSTFGVGGYVRAGWWFSDSTLIYTKVGIGTSYYEFDKIPETWHDYTKVGFGVEFLVGEKWMIRAEYSSDFYFDKELLSGNYEDLEGMEEKVRFGLTYHF